MACHYAGSKFDEGVYRLKSQMDHGHDRGVQAVGFERQGESDSNQRGRSPDACA